MATYSDIVPKPDERMFVCGQSGSGKTTLIKKIISLLPNELIIIIDSKPDWEMIKEAWQFWRKEDIPIRLHLRMLPTLPKKGVYIYRTTYPDVLDSGVEKIILWALKRKNVTLIIDELGDFAKGSYTTPAIGKAIRQGRSKKVGMIIGAQRPSQIPLIAITESTKFAVFELISEDDRKRLSKWVHPLLEKSASGHDFWYLDTKITPRQPVLMHQEAKRK